MLFLYNVIFVTCLLGASQPHRWERAGAGQTGIQPQAGRPSLKQIDANGLVHLGRLPGLCLILDLRAEQDYHAGHIDRALPAYEDAGGLSLEAERALPSASIVIFHVNKGELQKCARAIQDVGKHGNYACFYYSGGMEEWRAARNGLL